MPKKGNKLFKVGLMSQGGDRHLTAILTRDLLKEQNAIGLAGPDHDGVGWDGWLQGYTDEFILPKLFLTTKEKTKLYMSNKKLVHNYVRQRAAHVAKCERSKTLEKSGAGESLPPHRPTPTTADDHPEYVEAEPSENNMASVDAAKGVARKYKGFTISNKRAVAKIKVVRKRKRQALLEHVSDVPDPGTPLARSPVDSNNSNSNQEMQTSSHPDFGSLGDIVSALDRLVPTPTTTAIAPSTATVVRERAQDIDSLDTFTHSFENPAQRVSVFIWSVAVTNPTPTTVVEQFIYSNKIPSLDGFLRAVSDLCKVPRDKHIGGLLLVGHHRSVRILLCQFQSHWDWAVATGLLCARGEVVQARLELVEDTAPDISMVGNGLLAE